MAKKKVNNLMKAKESKVVDKAEVKEVKVKEETKKITAKPEAKKITVKPEAKKITAKPEAKKITAKEEAKKIAAKPVAKKIAAKPEAKKLTVKAEAKKLTVTEETKKEAVKKPVKTPKKPKEKVVESLPFSVEEGIAKMNALEVYYTFDEYHRILLENETVDRSIEWIKQQCRLYNFDDSILTVLFADLIHRADVNRKSFVALGKDLKEIMARKTTNLEEDSQLYHDTFYQAGKILEYGERFKINQLGLLSEWTKVDLLKYYNFYMDMAMKVLKDWEDKDIENYEDFMSEVISQFEECQELDFRYQIDCADLQIGHSFFAKGDSTFEYLLRENEIKDYIFYRFANAYVDINIDKAKWIANRGFEFVDERYVYYPKLIEIINK